MRFLALTPDWPPKNGGVTGVGPRLRFGPGPILADYPANSASGKADGQLKHLIFHGTQAGGRGLGLSAYSGASPLLLAGVEAPAWVTQLLGAFGPSPASQA